MKIRRVIIFLVAAILVISIVGSIGGYLVFTKSFQEPDKSFTLYECDVKVIALSTKIEMKKEGNQIGTIKGKVIRLVTDPLILYNNSETQIGYASDSYQFIGQDNHSIYVNNEFVCDMVGEWKLFGEQYKLYDSQRNYLGELKVSPFNLLGGLFDQNGEMVAMYSSPFWRKDYKVQIYEGCTFDEYSVMLMFASYYSDYEYDSSNSNNSSR